MNDDTNIKNPITTRLLKTLREAAVSKRGRLFLACESGQPVVYQLKGTSPVDPETGEKKRRTDLLRIGPLSRAARMQWTPTQRENIALFEQDWATHHALAEA